MTLLGGLVDDEGVDEGVDEVATDNVGLCTAVTRAGVDAGLVSRKGSTVG